jgi:hypothetical protein
MKPDERLVLEEAVADVVRIVADLQDVAGAIAMAAKMVADALERIEVDILAIHSAISDDGS